MSDGLSYIGVELGDGSGGRFYDLKKNAIPDGITYGSDGRTNRWFVIGLRGIG